MTDYFQHPKALVDSDDVGRGTRVWAFAHVMQGAVVGEDCNIGGGSFVESGVIIGDRVTIKNNCLIWAGVVIDSDVFIGPSVVFTNDLNPRPLNKTPERDFMSTVVEQGVAIGANSTIRCGVHLAAHSFVGAGSVVTRATRRHEIIFGNPATHRGWMCVCGGKVERLSCLECGRVFEERDDGLH